MQSRKRIAIVATVPVVLHVFMREHIKRLSADHDITLICPGERADVDELLSGHVSFLSYAIERKISLLQDVRSLWNLWRVLTTGRFDCVLSLMPKSGLVAMLAGLLSGTRCRVHIFTGQVWATRHGLGRRLLMALDRLLASAATHLLTDSYSQRDFLISSGVIKSSKIRVLGKGSISGVDTERFRPDPLSREQLRAQMGIPESALVYLFLGRVNRAKGILDLAKAFSQLEEACPQAHLLVVGPDDDSLDEELAGLLASRRGNFHRVGFTKTPERYMAMSDVFCMPSYREGFGQAVIEAAAVGLPSMVSRIYGLTDAVEDEVTGIFHNAGDVSGIKQAFGRLYQAETLRTRLGLAALSRARRDFSQDEVVGEMHAFIASII
ncbi:glycosyltransferase [Pseudomonas sp. PCH44]|uniref:glycosyltransferase n=1 Tax=Pseudomonas sp. PCH44 TaxID=2800904 RepID=UPI001BAF4A95|nr:glycosyltransferase [Pseudomonas sp. PCH44]MBS3186413.1 glycosyltransferase [Pseudomonas sp. PCH44]